MRLYSLLCIAAAAGLLAYADNRKDKATHTSPGGTWRLKSITWSNHDGEHKSGDAMGWDGICVFLKKKPSGSASRIKGQYITPFVSVISGEDLAIACNQGRWWKSYITDAKGRYKMWGGRVLVGSGTSTAAHTVAPANRVSSVAVAWEDKPLIDWSSAEAPQPLASDFEEGGAILEDENGDGVFDANGDPVWATPPAVVLRLTSSVAYSGGGVVAYTHTLENFSDTARTFSFPDLTSQEYPTGWSGTVPAYGSVSMSLTDTPSEAVCAQNLLAQTWGDDADAFEHTLTLRVYVPESRLTTTVQAAITSAFHDSLAGLNRISFQLSEPADGAVLYRVHEGDVELVDELTGPLAAGTIHDMEDGTFEPGTNSYSVMAGIRVNGYRSAEAPILNP